jgi:hypothetical protein
VADKITRNWISEAVSIASGESRLLPEKEHLQVLANHAEASIAKLVKIAGILVALMIDNDMEEATVPGELITTAKGMGLDIQTARRDNGDEFKDGTIVLTLKRATPPTAKQMPPTAPKLRLM